MAISRENRRKNLYMLRGLGRKNSYDWWWHSFTGYNKISGEQKSFFIEYFVINPAVSPRTVQFGNAFSAVKKSQKPSYVMIKAGAWGNDAKQIHNFYPVKDLSCNKHRLDLRVGSCTLTEKNLTGSVSLNFSEAHNHPEYMSSSGSMSWNLQMDKQIPYNVGYGTSGLFRSLWPFEMYWHAQGVKTLYAGSVILDGEEYTVTPQRSFGYADKNWGRDFTNPWLWLSSCNLISLISGQRLKNSCFDIGGGRPKFLGRQMKKKLLFYFYHEGDEYEFNFSKFWKKSTVKYTFTQNGPLAHWAVTAENKKYFIDVDVYCKKSDMLLINYTAPNGLKLHNNLWNGGTGYGEIRLYKKVKKNLETIEHARIENCGCEYGEY